MAGPEQRSRLRHLLVGLILWVIALMVFALAVALIIIFLVGIAVLGAGLASWLHPVNVASAWARSLAGIGLIGGSAGLAALGWLAVERLAAPLGELARLRRRVVRPASEGETAIQRARKFVAVIGILLALVCLPFAVAIHTTAHAPWLGWGETRAGGA